MPASFLLIERPSTILSVFFFLRFALPSFSFLASSQRVISIYIYIHHFRFHTHTLALHMSFCDLIQYNEAFALHETLIVKEGVELTKGTLR